MIIRIHYIKRRLDDSAAPWIGLELVLPPPPPKKLPKKARGAGPAGAKHLLEPQRRTDRGGAPSKLEELRRLKAQGKISADEFIAASKHV